MSEAKRLSEKNYVISLTRILSPTQYQHKLLASSAKLTKAHQFMVG